MNARDRLHSQMQDAGFDGEHADHLIDDFAHQLADLIRIDAQARYDRDFSDNRIFRFNGATSAADLIDTEVKP